MLYNLAAPADFLSTWWGLTIFILLDIAVLLLIIAINYKWFFKRALDILFSAVFLIVFFPFFLIFLIADAIYNKSQNAYPALFVREYCCGKKGKPVRYTVFATARIQHDENGKLLPESERTTGMGRVLRACGMKYYPALLSVFAGGLSFVGPRPMALADAAAVGEDGVRRVVGLACVDAESYASWKGFLRGLRERGLSGVQCVTSDAHGGIARAVRELFPGAAWQRCVAHLERDVIDACPTRAKRAAAGRVLHAVFDEDDPARVRALYRAACGVISSLSADAGRVMEGAEADALAYLDFPEAHCRRIRTNNVQERANREIKRRARVVQSFPSEEALIRLVGAVCCEASEDWFSRRYMEPSAIEGLWERELLPVPEPTEGQVTRARSRIAALSGIDEGAMAA